MFILEHTSNSKNSWGNLQVKTQGFAQCFIVVEKYMYKLSLEEVVF